MLLQYMIIIKKKIFKIYEVDYILAILILQITRKNRLVTHLIWTLKMVRKRNVCNFLVYFRYWTFKDKFNLLSIKNLF